MVRLRHFGSRHRRRLANGVSTMLDGLVLIGSVVSVVLLWSVVFRVLVLLTSSLQLVVLLRFTRLDASLLWLVGSGS